MGYILAVTTSIGLLAFAVAQFPPTPQGVTTIKSKYNSDITISYKEVRLCSQ